MLKQLKISIKITLVTLVIVSFAYPAIIFVIAQIAFPKQANGSLVRDSSGTIVGSALLGQNFAKAQYFQPRPSAAGNGYDPTQSGGTNLGPTSDKLINGTPKLINGKPNPSYFEGVKNLADDYRATNGLPAGAAVPVDAVTRSASGLDPDISPENAALQVARVAKARGVDAATIQTVVDQNTEQRDLGFLGEPRVNVLLLNLAIDSKYPAK